MRYFNKRGIPAVDYGAGSETPCCRLEKELFMERERGITLKGTIVRLQVQRSSLKVGQAGARRYDPTPIVPVPALSVTVDGVCGHDDTGAEIVDVHNATHPLSKNRARTNGVSIGFTSHYEAMRERFGEHVVDGLAGENILIELDGMVNPQDMPDTLVIQGDDGQEILLTDIIVAAPCVEFSRFAMQYPPDAKPNRTVSEALKFLNYGMRGYYARLSNPELGRISVGSTIHGE
jgi:hypothetical protein